MKNYSRKAISSVLIVTIALSLSACYSDNRGVIEAAEEYAEAIIEMDAGDIADIMSNDDDVEYAFYEYNKYKQNDAKLKKVFEAISDSMTYEIDRSSVNSSLKNNKGSCDIIFTLVDYETIYDELDDGDDIDDYIDALEENPNGDTIKIKISVDFVYKRNHWLVKDNDCENLAEIYEFVDEVIGYDFCNFDAIDIYSFEKALESLGLEEDYDYYVYEEDNTWIDDCNTVIYGYDGNCYYEFLEFDDPADAADYFEDTFYDGFENMIIDEDFDGKYKMDFNNGSSTGYLIFNGEADSYEFYDGDFYGGIYCKKGIIVSAYALSNNSSDIEDIDTFLNAIDYPTP